MKQYEVTFYTLEGKPVKMLLWLSDEIAAMSKRPMKLIKKKKS